MTYGDAKGTLWLMLADKIYSEDIEKAILKALLAMETLEDFECNMRDYILDNYKGEFDNVEDAKAYLYDPDLYEDLDDAAIIKAANELQVAYYNSNCVTFDEILEMYHALINE